VHEHGTTLDGAEPDVGRWQFPGRAGRFIHREATALRRWPSAIMHNGGWKASNANSRSD